MYREYIEWLPKSGYIDVWGRSTLKIIGTCKEAGLPEPELLEKVCWIQVTLFKSEGGPMGGTMGGPIEKIRSEFGSHISRAEVTFEKINVI